MTMTKGHNMSMTIEVPKIFDVDDMSQWLRDNLELIDADTFHSAVVTVGRNGGPALLFDMHFSGRMTDAVLAEVIGGVWTGAEFPARSFDPPELWADLFDAAGYTVDGKPAERPTEPLRLYRGATVEHKAGWSWTDDLQVAQRFAGDLLGRSKGQVWTALIDPADLLARIDDREESEYVVNPECLVIEPLK